MLNKPEPTRQKTKKLRRYATAGASKGIESRRLMQPAWVIYPNILNRALPGRRAAPKGQEVACDQVGNQSRNAALNADQPHPAEALAPPGGHLKKDNP
jgi:hypothetical protein